MKTAIIYQEIPENTHLFVVDGDYSHLHDVYINTMENQEKQNELNNLIYDEKEYHKHKVVSILEIKNAVRDGAELIMCGCCL